MYILYVIYYTKLNILHVPYQFIIYIKLKFKYHCSCSPIIHSFQDSKKYGKSVLTCHLFHSCLSLS